MGEGGSPGPVVGLLVLSVPLLHDLMELAHEGPGGLASAWATCLLLAGYAVHPGWDKPRDR
ncbi:hypothetical protein GCM10010399_47870 [Dactylosporangium fulvum]